MFAHVFTSPFVIPSARPDVDTMLHPLSAVCQALFRLLFRPAPSFFADTELFRRSNYSVGAQGLLFRRYFPRQGGPVYIPQTQARAKNARLPACPHPAAPRSPPGPRLPAPRNATTAAHRPSVAYPCAPSAGTSAGLPRSATTNSTTGRHATAPSADLHHTSAPSRPMRTR